MLSLEVCDVILRLLFHAEKQGGYIAAYTMILRMGSELLGQ